jgi:FkbM family methyltransferase
MNSTIKLFRQLPNFRGKFRLAHALFGKGLIKEGPLAIKGRKNIVYHIPNTIDNIGKELFIKGVYEKITIDLVTGLLKEGDLFFDVGANIGAISVPVAKFTNADVHAFEPSKRTFQFLKKNMEVNHLTKMTLNEKAVNMNDGGEAMFYDVPHNYGGSALIQTYGEQPHYLVKTVSIDDYCKRNDIQSIQVMKIDVQGFEIEVLKGCHQMLAQRTIKNILFEFEGWAETNANFGAGRAQEYLVEMGYELYTLKDRKLGNIIRSGSEMIWAKSKNQ